MSLCTSYEWIRMAWRGVFQFFDVFDERHRLHYELFCFSIQELYQSRSSLSNLYHLLTQTLVSRQPIGCMKIHCLKKNGTLTYDFVRSGRVENNSVYGLRNIYRANQF
jgi:hypothetical protein